MSATIDRFVELLQTGKEDDARRTLDGGGVNPLDQKVGKGVLLARQGKWDEAGRMLESVLDEDPNHVEAAFHLAYLADLRGDDNLALDLYEQVTANAPTHANALMNLAVLYEDDDRFSEALSCVERILSKYPNHSRARLFKKDIVASLDMYYDEDRERSREKRNAILDTPITEFELSVRSRNCLKQMNLNTLGDLLKATASELLSYKNFGETSLHEIEAVLAQKGLRLGQLLEDREPDISRFLLTPPPADPVKAGVCNRSVAELELSVRARKCLMRLGVASIGELCDRTEPELLSIKNFGMTSLAEIKRRLTELGLSLKGG